MSAARKCDLCGTLFEPELGCLSVDLNLYLDPEIQQGWSDIDLCLPCAEPVLTHLRDACNDIEKHLGPKPS